jgi:hypothetical protein
VLEAVFILLEPPSTSRRIFIGSHSLPPSLFAVSFLHICLLAFPFFIGISVGNHLSQLGLPPNLRALLDSNQSTD